MKFAGSNTLEAIITKIKSLIAAATQAAEGASSAASAAQSQAKYFGTCATAAGTAAKVVTCTGFSLLAGVRIAVTFTYANTASSVSFNINGTGAVDGVWMGSTSSAANLWEAGETLILVYNGSNLVITKPKSVQSADSATKLASSRTISLTGGVTGSGTFDGSGDLAIPTTIAGNAPSATKLQTARTIELTGGVTGSGQFDGSGNLQIATTIAGNAATATKLASARTIQLTGAVTGSATFDGSANCSISTTISSVAASAITGTLPISKGGTGATTAAAALKALGGASTTTYTVSVNTTWSSYSGGGYYKTVTVSGMLSTDNPVADIVLSTDVSASKLQLEAWACVSHITTANNSITIYCYDSKPTVTMSVQFLCVRAA